MTSGGCFYISCKSYVSLRALLKLRWFFEGKSTGSLTFQLFLPFTFQLLPARHDTSCIYTDSWIDNFVSMSWPPFNKRSLALKLQRGRNETVIPANSWYGFTREMVLLKLHREKKKKEKKKIKTFSFITIFSIIDRLF